MNSEIKIHLFVDEKQTIHNVLVGEVETSSILSLKKLKKDVETGETDCESDKTSTKGSLYYKILIFLNLF